MRNTVAFPAAGASGDKPRGDSRLSARQANRLLAAHLPPLSVAERDAVARLAREGPPDEALGLEPYGPPEAMPAGARP